MHQERTVSFHAQGVLLRSECVFSLSRALAPKAHFFLLAFYLFTPRTCLCTHNAFILFHAQSVLLCPEHAFTPRARFIFSHSEHVLSFHAQSMPLFPECIFSLSRLRCAFAPKVSFAPKARFFPFTPKACFCIHNAFYLFTARACLCTHSTLVLCHTESMFLFLCAQRAFFPCAPTTYLCAYDVFYLFMLRACICA